MNHQNSRKHCCHLMTIGMLLAGLLASCAVDGSRNPTTPMAVHNESTSTPGSSHQPAVSPGPIQAPDMEGTAQGQSSIPVSQSAGSWEALPVATGAAPTPTPELSRDGYLLYYTQSGDTLPTIALHFGVLPEEIVLVDDVAPSGFVAAGQAMLIPDILGETGPNLKLLPDSEFIFSKTASGFDARQYAEGSPGYLTSYLQMLSDGWHYGDEVVQKLAWAYSVNPRLILAVLEHQSGWVSRDPMTTIEAHYPMHYANRYYKGLHDQLVWALRHMSFGYYSWRDGTLTEIEFTDGVRMRLAPDLNAGTVALQYYFSQVYTYREWMQNLYGADAFCNTYIEMFGDPWERAALVEPLIPEGLVQPDLVLPFEPGVKWTFTGGPHSNWGTGDSLAALDFAPVGVINCSRSDEWVTASGPGHVVFADNGLVVVDMDEDGNEHTGWNITYMHIATQNRVSVGDVVETNDLIGNPSCAGGGASGTHLHFSRRYNGEWMLLNGPAPLELDGWVTVYTDHAYRGLLVRDNVTVEASNVSEATSLISRD